MQIRARITVTAVLLVLLASSCAGRHRNDPNSLRVGVAAGPEYVLAETACKVAKETYGLEVELVAFNDYIMPNTSLAQGDIDVNVFQTKPYLDDQASRRGYRFAVVGRTFIYPMAAYSRKIKTPDELRDGSTVVIPNDFANSARALLLLQEAGLIKLRDGATAPRRVDIVENPKRLDILELEAPQLARVLDDARVSLAVINNNFAGQAGLLLRDGVFAEAEDSPYVNLIVTREADKDDARVKQFVRAYQSDQVDRVAADVFKGGAVKGW